MVLKSFLPDVVIPEKPLGQFLVDSLEKFGDETAILEVHSERETTFKALREEILQMAKLLWKAGLQKGDIVGLVLPFDMQYVPLIIAINYCGAVSFGTKLLYQSSIHNQLAAMKPTLIVTTDERFEELSADIKSNVPSAKLCLSFDQLQNIQTGSLRKVVDDLPCFEAIDVHNDPVIIYQSSGTTGEPKGVVATHYKMMAMIHIFMAISNRLHPGDVIGSLSPIIHVQSLGQMFFCLSQGIKFVYAKSLTAEQHLEVISKYKVNSMGIFNVNVLKRMVELCTVDSKYDLSSLRSVMLAGNTFPPDLIQDARGKLGTVVAMGYGMTEAGLVALGTSNKAPSNSVGLLLSNMELKVVDKDTRKELECGDKGEICVRGPQIMTEYYLHDGSQFDALENDGWLSSGDLGYYDKKGYIYVVGRSKDAIKIQPGNVTVMPAELEDILLRHRQIADVTIAGVPHPDYGEAPRAFVVRKDNNLTEDEVVKFFESETEQFTSLHGGVEFVDVIPRTEIGKPLRRKLIENSIS